MCSTVYSWRHLVKATKVTAGLDSGRYCILARNAKDEINAARHSRKVGQPCKNITSYNTNSKLAFYLTVADVVLYT